MRRPRPVKSILIPANKSKLITRITVRTLEDVERAVGGLSEECMYDLDSIAFVYDNGRNEGQPYNERINKRVLQHSDAFKQGRMHNAERCCGLYGDVLLTGQDDKSRPADLPERHLKFFEESYGIEQPGPTMGLAL